MNRDVGNAGIEGNWGGGRKEWREIVQKATEKL